MQAPYIEEEIEQLLQELGGLPPDTAGYDFALDPSVLTSNIQDEASLSYFTPLPSILEDSTSSMNSDAGLNEARLRDVEEQLKSSQAEIESLMKTMMRIKAYLSDLHPWTLEITEALDKLGEIPSTTTEHMLPIGDDDEV
ncbi:hypothetical protein BDV37DRAFT_259675 [Aspergillus pseudonomiae]|uniref:Uncharacterized protein n=1 Tax=Aspergillus pseudonomiae TaxID=1506151 RepID=A0A5N7D1S5_9EURO|nr:uncharacterized protein BDV37DRAFT_259675 [Aspergillus pseudonomiae]KAE8399778.1 hypothetical protein BDV37DRAFT_259675 [Aspergillus pseudonomiae]